MYLITFTKHKETFCQISLTLCSSGSSGVADLWLKQARFSWRPDDEDTVDDDGVSQFHAQTLTFSTCTSILGAKVV